jgi:hypothetical protein
VFRPSIRALAICGLLVLGACSSSHAARPRPTPTPSPSPSPAPSPSPTPDPFGPPLPAPLGGPLPGQGDPVSGPLGGPLLIQIENTAPSRPQAGLDAASVIFQSLAEGNITRFSALFHRVPGVVGPVRSARYVTVYLAQRFSAEIMCSGGSPSTLARLVAARVPTLVNDSDGGHHFFRWSGRAPPHNVYTTESQMVAAGSGIGPPGSSIDFPRSDTWEATEPAPTITVAAHRTSFAYNNGAYDIVTEGSPLTDVVFGSVRPYSVAVLHVPQFRVPSVVDVAGSPVMDYNLAAGGAAEMYANGTVIHGQWSAPGVSGRITLSDAAGNPVSMPRGLMWVSLAP